MNFNLVYQVKEKNATCKYCGKNAAYKTRDILYCPNHFKKTNTGQLMSKIRKLEIRDDLKRFCNDN